MPLILFYPSVGDLEVLTFGFFLSHVSLELGEEIKQMISRHGPILKSRQPSVSVSMPSLSRQTSRDPGLPGQVI
jgi:hypothetical protein